jgi:hypothetical protein
MGCKAQFAANSMTIGKNRSAADHPILRMPATRWVTQRIRKDSASQGRTARFKKRSPSGGCFALQKKKNNSRQHHWQHRQGRHRQGISVAKLVVNAAIRGVGMGREKVTQPAMRMTGIIGLVTMRRCSLVSVQRTVCQPMHQPQHGRKQQHQGQIAPGRPTCHAPEAHAWLFHCHRVIDTVIQAIGIVMQHLQAAFDHHRLQAVFDWRFGPDLNHALRPASQAKRAAQRHR